MYGAGRMPQKWATCTASCRTLLSFLLKVAESGHVPALCPGAADGPPEPCVSLGFPEVQPSGQVPCWLVGDTQRQREEEPHSPSLALVRWWWWGGCYQNLRVLTAFTLAIILLPLLRPGDSGIFPMEYFARFQGSGLECVVGKKHLTEF